MAAAVLHDLHTCRHVTLAQTEREAIASSPTPINVFWINLINIHDPIKWPQNRQYTAFSKKTTTGVFVTYQSDQTPLSSFGVCGDLWVTSDRLFIKETDGSWTVWNRGVQFRFPFDQSRRLVWSHNAHFKYLGDETVRTEALRWKKGGVPFSSIPTYARDRSPHIKSVLQKGYKELTEADCVLLLNTYLNHVRIRGPCDEGHGGKVVVLRDQHNRDPFAGPNEVELGLEGDLDDTPQQFSPQGTEILCKSSQQPMFKPFLARKYRTPLDHRQSAGYVKCFNGMEVFLPFNSKSSENKESSQIATCKWLLSGSDATATPTKEHHTISKLPLVAVLDAPPPGCHITVWEKHRDEVRNMLSSGRVVAVLNGVVDGPSYSWDEESLVSVTRRQGDGALIQWQSAQADEKSYDEKKALATIKGTIRNFMQAELNPKDSVNCLDIPTFGGEIPPLIRELATSSRALCGTAGVTFEYSNAQPQKPRLSESRQTDTGNATIHKYATRSAEKRDASPSGFLAKRRKTEGVSMEDSSHLGPFAAGSGMHRCNASSEGDRDINIPAPPSAREKKGIDAILNEAVTSVNANGPMHSIEWDAVRIASWAIIASSGAVSKTHHDASGYSTYVKCEMGAKIWGYVLPKKPSHSLDQSMKEYHRMVTKCTETSELAKVAEPVNIYLPRGTLLIQPPGALHLVYTLERSIFTCGHFYTLESMHLTEVARACAACTNQRGTNASHPGSARVLSRIALSLVFDWHPSVLRKPFISLARMLLWADVYAPGDIDSDDPKFMHSQESTAELAAAQAVAEIILEHNNIFLEDIRPEPLRSYRWLSNMGEGSDWADWRDPGTATLDVPDVRSRFVAFKGVFKG